MWSQYIHPFFQILQKTDSEAENIPIPGIKFEWEQTKIKWLLRMAHVSLLFILILISILGFSNPFLFNNTDTDFYGLVQTD